MTGTITDSVVVRGKMERPPPFSGGASVLSARNWICLECKLRTGPREFDVHLPLSGRAMEKPTENRSLYQSPIFFSILISTPLHCFRRRFYFTRILSDASGRVGTQLTKLRNRWDIFWSFAHLLPKLISNQDELGSWNGKRCKSQKKKIKSPRWLHYKCWNNLSCKGKAHLLQSVLEWDQVDIVVHT